MEFDKDLNIIMTRDEYLSQHRIVSEIIDQVKQLEQFAIIAVPEDLVGVYRAIDQYLETTNSSMRQLLGLPQIAYLQNGKQVTN